jgi:hypothetical protein
MLSDLTHIKDKMDEYSTLLNARIVTLTTQLSQAKSENTKRNREIEIINEKMSKISKDLENRIDLNIGGTIFSTTLSVLTCEKDTFFTAMFSDQFQTKPDEKGQYFIDRDPSLFKYIINYLRSSFNEPDWYKLYNKGLLEKFEDEVEYYQIHSLRDKIASEIVLRSHPLEILVCSPFFKVEWPDPGRSVMITRPVDRWGTRGILFEKCMKWRFKLLTHCGSIQIGMIAPRKFNVDTTSSGNGWYVGNDGFLYSVDRNAGQWSTIGWDIGDVVDFEYKNGTLSVGI